MATKADQKRAKLRYLKESVSPIKSRLMDVLRQVEELDKREADSLGRIIGRLEDWQHRGV